MQAYKAIGTTLCSILSLVVVFILIAALLLASTSAVVSDETVDEVSRLLVKDDMTKEVTKDHLLSMNILGSSSLSEEGVDALLESAAVEKGFAEMMSDAISSLIAGTKDDLDTTDTFLTMVEEEPALISNVIYQVFYNESLDYDAIYQVLTGFDASKGNVPATVEDPRGANLPPIEIPKYGAELSELIKTWIKNNPDKLNSAVFEYVLSLDSLSALLGSMDLSDIGIDYVVSEDGESPEQGEGEMLITAVGSEELLTTTSDPAATAKARLMDILRLAGGLDPIGFVLIAAAILAALYLVGALLTWSFRTPLIFVGLVSLLGGGSTLLISLTVPQLIAAVDMTSSTELLKKIINIASSVMQTKLSLYGVIFMVIGAVSFILFAVTKRRASPSYTAEEC